MDFVQERQALSFVLGAVIGAGAGFLTMPQPGRKARKRIRHAAGRIQGTATDWLDDPSSDLKGKIDDTIRLARSALRQKGKQLGRA
jgi:gas vesicle protein